MGRLRSRKGRPSGPVIERAIKRKRLRAQKRKLLKLYGVRTLQEAIDAGFLRPVKKIPVPSEVSPDALK